MRTIVKRTIKQLDVNAEIVKSIVLKYKINKKFTLSSGRKSDFYYDIKSLLLTCVDWNQISSILVKDLKSKFPGVSHVAGSGVGGILFAMKISSCFDICVDPIIVRDSEKTHGLLKQIEGNLPIGCPRTVIVDDVVTTGKSFRKTSKILNSNGIKVLGNYALLKRKESHFKCESLILI